MGVTKGGTSKRVLESAHWDGNEELKMGKILGVGQGEKGDGEGRSQ